MRRFLLATSIVLFPWFFAPIAAAQPNDPRSLIERAIDAQGGRENLNRAKAGSRKTKGVFHGDNFKFTGESFGDANDRAKLILEGDENNPITIVMVIDGDKGWDAVNGNVVAFDAKRKKQMRIASHADKVTSLIALLDDPGYTLALLGESKVKDRTVRGIKVRFAGMPDINLYFDKATGFLVKTVYRMVDIETDKDYLREVYYSRFEAFDPAAEPLKVLQKAKQEVATSALLKFLKDRVPGKAERETIDVLILELGRSAFSAREKASAALKKFGARAAGPLRAALKSPDPEVVRRAEYLLENLGQSAETDQASAVVRLLAVRKPVGAADALIDYLPWANGEPLRKEVMFALVSLVERDNKARAAIEAMLKADDPQRRETAAAILGEDDGKFLKLPWRRMVVEGVTMSRAAQVFRDGQPYLDIESFDYQFYNRFDDAMFTRPK